MKKKIAIFAALGILAGGTAYGSGYRIPEQSINAVALSNAYIASSNGPDTAYYNPANMVWQEDRWQIEVSASFINLPHINYTDDNFASRRGSSKTEDIVIPMFHAVSPNYQGFRFGFSFLAPYGLFKRWEQTYPKTFTEEFSLHTFEGNPTISYKFDERFSMAVGARIMHSDGNKVKGNGVWPGTNWDVRRNLDGSDTNIGWNLATTFKPVKELTISATYRTQIDLDLDGGDVMLYLNIPGVGSETYTGNGEVTVVTPAVLSIATAYTFDKTTVELSWDKTFWSEYKELDFDYSGPLSDHPNPVINAILTGAMTALFDDPIAKNWKDSNAYRLGVTHRCTDRFTAMLGIAYDETPIPSESIGFELPGSDAMLYSLGFKYKTSENMELGGAYLYDHKKNREINNPDNTIINGEFTDAGAHVVTLGMVYKF